VYLPVASGTCPSSASTPFCSVSRFTRLAGLRTISDQPESVSLALLLVCTRTFSIVTLTASKPQAGASVSATRRVPLSLLLLPALPPPPPQAPMRTSSTVANAKPSWRCRFMMSTF